MCGRNYFSFLFYILCKSFFKTQFFATMCPVYHLVLWQKSCETLDRTHYCYINHTAATLITHFSLSADAILFFLLLPFLTFNYVRTRYSIKSDWLYKDVDTILMICPRFCVFVSFIISLRLRRIKPSSLDRSEMMH